MEKKGYRRRFEEIGIGSTVLTVLVIIGLIVGLWQGWLNVRWVSTDTKESTERGLAVTLDTKEIAEDAAAVEQAASAVAELVTVKGRITEIDSENRVVTLKTPEDEPVTVMIEDSTDLLSTNNQKVSLNEFKNNDQVTVVYKASDENINVARKFMKLEDKGS